VDAFNSRMARRSLSTQGRVVAAGACIALGGALVGFMAAGDHSATASSSTNTSSANASADGGSGTTATPAQGNDGSFGGFPSGTTSGGTSFQPQPQTRTGGS
jgi:hypothetical protein